MTAIDLAFVNKLRATADSVERLWLEYEIERAEMQRLAGQLIGRSMAFNIDPNSLYERIPCLRRRRVDRVYTGIRDLLHSLWRRKRRCRRRGQCLDSACEPTQRF